MLPLLKLVWLKLKGTLRRTVRVQGNPKKLILLLVGIVSVSLWFGSLILSAALRPRHDSTFAQEFAPLILAAFALLSILVSSGDGAIAFQPAEVDILFPAPFTRRQLLGYKLLSTMLGTLFGAFLFSLAFARQAGSWIAAYVGILLGLWFMQFLATGLALVKQIIGELAYTRARRILLAVVLLVPAVLLIPSFSDNTVHDLPTFAHLVNTSTFGRIVLAPFRVFGDIIASTSRADMLYHSAIGLAIDILLAALVLRLDVSYLEASIRASERHAERIKRARAGNLFAPTPGKAVRSRQVRSSLWLGGAIPIAWRHTATVLRGGKRWVFQLLLIIAVSAILLSSLSRIRPDNPGASIGMAIAVLMYVTLFLAAMLRFDFRTDLEHLETLKTLPISPRAIALGELLLPTLLLTIIQLLFLIAVASVFHWPPRQVVPIAAALPLANLLFLSVENLLFLLFPVRLAHRGVGDFSLLGRRALLFLGKLVIYSLLGALAFGVVLAARALTNSDVTAYLVGWLTLALASIAAVLAVARAFHAFDVSADMPA